MTKTDEALRAAILDGLCKSSIERDDRGTYEVRSMAPAGDVVDDILQAIKPVVDVNDAAKAKLARYAEMLGMARLLSNLAASVMTKLKKHGGGIVPHLLDTDDNDGQDLREVIDEFEDRCVKEKITAALLEDMTND